METKRNPLGLNIGDKVYVTNRSLVEYDIDNNRVVLLEKFERECYITGVVKKALGKYIGGRGVGSFYEYEPPYLRVSHYIYLYECKESINSKPILAHPGDIKLCT